jgi:hypothetical protein
MNRSVVVAAITGTIAGIVGSAIGNVLLSKNQQPRPPAPPTDVDLRPSVEDWSRLPDQIAATMALGAAKKSRDERPGPTTESGPPGDALGRVKGAFTAHEHEVEDLPWAKRTKEQLSTDLRDLSEAAGIRGFELECRSRTCVGFIEWPSFGAAMQNLPRILHKEYRVNSSVRFLPPTNAPNGSCRVSVIFEPAPGS